MTPNRDALETRITPSNITWILQKIDSDIEYVRQGWKEDSELRGSVLKDLYDIKQMLERASC